MYESQTETTPRHLDLFSEELTARFETEGILYRRKKEPIREVQQVTDVTLVETLLPDGTLESTQEAKNGDWIITGSKGERFVFTNEKFERLYHHDDSGRYVPKERKILAISNPLKHLVRIRAPWGGTQDGSEKAILVAELDSDGNMTEDRYIIGDEEILLNTYEPADL